MKVFIIGIAGQTGLRLAHLLCERGDKVGGLHRRAAQADALRAAGAVGTLGDIAQIAPAQLAEHVRGSDAIVFTAGAGESDNDAMTTAVDGDGVDKTIAAARLAGVRRVILVSAFPEAWRERETDAGFEHYMQIKKRADVALARSDLDWIILRPSELTTVPGTGFVSLGPANFHTTISRDDVAGTLAALIHAPQVRRRILELTEGETPVEQAVAAQLDD